MLVSDLTRMRSFGFSFTQPGVPWLFHSARSSLIVSLSQEPPDCFTQPGAPDCAALLPFLPQACHSAVSSQLGSRPWLLHRSKLSATSVQYSASRALNYSFSCLLLWNPGATEEYSIGFQKWQEMNVQNCREAFILKDTSLMFLICNKYVGFTVWHICSKEMLPSCFTRKSIKSILRSEARRDSYFQVLRSTPPIIQIWTVSTFGSLACSWYC